MEFFSKQTNFPFMATRKIWYALSAALMIASLALFFARGLNLAVDFTGGTTFEASFPDTAPIEKIREGLEEAGFEEPGVQNFGSSREVAIRLPPLEGRETPEIRAQVEGVLKAIDPAAVIDGGGTVGPQVGAELRNSAILSLIHI